MADNQLSLKREQGQRFKVLYQKLGLKQVGLAEIIDADQENISMAINGKRYVQEVWLYKLREKYSNVNADWVLNGTGDMFIQEPDILASGVEEPGIEYKKGNARALSGDEVAVMLARLQKEVAELNDWKKEASRAIGVLEVQVKRLKGK